MLKRDFGFILLLFFLCERLEVALRIQEKGGSFFRLTLKKK